MSPHYTNIQEFNPSDGHAYQTNPNDARDSRCFVCRAWHEEHACEICGERQGDHTEAMRAYCGARYYPNYPTQLPPTCGCDCHTDESVMFCACGTECLGAPPSLFLPTCGHCGGIGHRQNDHDVHIHPAPERLGAVVLAHAAELRAMADDLRDNLGPIGTPVYVARSARAEAYEEVAKRLERDAQ